jgi:hypothetical protein
MSAQPSVGISAYYNGILTVAGVQYRCFSVKQFHTVNEFSIAELTIAAAEKDNPELPGTIKAVYDKLLKAVKGDPVTADFTVSEPEDKTVGQKAVNGQVVRVFTGVFLGMGPVYLAPHYLRVTVWAVHPLGQLDWASTELDAVHGFGMDDYKVPMVPGLGEELVPYMLGGYTADNVKTDLWKQVIKPELIALCKTNRFGVANSRAIVDYLGNEANDVTKQPLSLNVSDPRKVILDVRRTLMSSAMGRRSLWDNLSVLANTYKFSIICRANDFMVVPALPALGGTISSDKHYPLRCLRFAEREEYNALARQVEQSIGMIRGPGGLSDFFDTEARKRNQAFRPVTSDKVVAGTRFIPIPRFLDFTMDPFFSTGITLGLKKEKLAAVGYKISSDPVKEPTSLNKQYNAMADVDLQNYADVCQNEVSFDAVTAVYKGGINWNICPGNSVQLEPPGYYNTPSDTLTVSMYGRVWSVATILDPGVKQTGTYLILTHVRTDKEQAAIALTKHPMYDKRWVSSSLLDIPLFTEKPVYA